MRLKYMGPRPIITHHGVSFKEGKEDKYVYLVSVIEILHALEHIDDVTKEFHYYEKNLSLKDCEMEDAIKKYHQDLECVMEQEIASFEKHLDQEEQSVDLNQVLKPEEKEALRNNYRYMRAYRIQRAKNKVFYFHAIHTVVELIKAKKIKKLATTFDEHHWHVLQTIEGDLMKGKGGLRATLETKSDKDNTLLITLSVAGYE